MKQFVGKYSKVEYHFVNFGHTLTYPVREPFKVVEDAENPFYCVYLCLYDMRATLCLCDMRVITGYIEDFK